MSSLSFFKSQKSKNYTINIAKNRLFFHFFLTVFTLKKRKMQSLIFLFQKNFFSFFKNNKHLTFINFLKINCL